MGFGKEEVAGKKKEELVKRNLWASSESSTKTSRGIGGAEAPTRKDIDELERLYYMEPLLFAGINFYKQVVARGFTIEVRSSQSRVIIEEFLQQVDMESIIEKIMQDLGIYGNAFVELIWDANRTKLLDLAIIDPKKMVFIKDTDDEILTDELGKPIGYLQMVSNYRNVERLEAILNEKGIPIDKVDYTEGGIPFAAKDIAHFRWHTLSDTLMGVGLVEPLYDDVILLLKIKESLANAINKYGYPTYIGKLGQAEVYEPDPEELKDFESEVLSKMEGINDLALPWYHDIKLLEVPRIDRLRVYLDFFVDLICTGMGVPHSILLRGERIGAGVSELQADQVEKNIVSIQRNIGRTIREQMFALIIETAGLTEIPEIKWKIISPLTLSAKSRRISELARAAILTPDRSLEQEIRRLEDIPLLPEETPEQQEKREEVRDKTLKYYKHGKQDEDNTSESLNKI